MYFRKALLSGLITFLFVPLLHGQDTDSVFILTATVYNESYQPLPGTHVINMNSHEGDVADSLGIFRLTVHPHDTLLFRNVAYLDSMVRAALLRHTRFITLRPAFYPLEEARIFEWGSTYGDFREAIISMPDQQTLGESLGLPQQDPDYIPYDMDESLLKSTGFLLSSPLSYLYHNLNRKAKSKRKVYWLEKNSKKHEIFDDIVSPEGISEITGLADEPLRKFMTYLFQRMVCDFKCSEYQIISEIHGHWEVYQKLN